jgi:hypothetical protein
VSSAGDREDQLQAVDATLATWRQGDCFLGEAWFVFGLASLLPLTDAAKEAASENLELAEIPVPGFVILTQTCDIVRPCQKRPFVEIAPLVEVNPDNMLEIQRGYRPQYAYIPGVSGQNLVADLDRVMTVEKAVVARWKRVVGCRTDDEARALAQAISRKRARVAFPDDFNELVGALHNRIKKKHDKDSPEGKALLALHEIRARAAPFWQAEAVELIFYFIRDDNEVTFQGKNWSDLLGQWLELVPKKGRYASIDGVVVTYDDLTAREYLESDRLDLDHLSLPRDTDRVR